MTQESTVHISPLMRELLAERAQKKARERVAAERGDTLGLEEALVAPEDNASLEARASNQAETPADAEAHAEAHADIHADFHVEVDADTATAAAHANQLAEEQGIQALAEPAPFPARALRLRRHGMRPLAFDGALVFSAATDAGVDSFDEIDEPATRCVGHLFELYAVHDGAAVARLVGRVVVGDAERRYEHAARIEGAGELATFLAQYHPDQLVVLHDSAWSLHDADSVEKILKAYETAVAAVRADFDDLKAKLPLAEHH